MIKLDITKKITVPYDRVIRGYGELFEIVSLNKATNRTIIPL